jgi:hypothetical protein
MLRGIVAHREAAMTEFLGSLVIDKKGNLQIDR